LGGSATGHGITLNTVRAASPSIGADLDGWPVVAYEDGEVGHRKIAALYYEYSAGPWSPFWGTAGQDISNSAYDAYAPSLATVSSLGFCAVAWEQAQPDGTTQIYARRYDHWGGWQELSGSASGGGVSNSPISATDPSLALNVDETPIIAWTEHLPGNTTQVYARSWNGRAWLEMAGSASGGGVSNTSGLSKQASLGVALDGYPSVAWATDTDGDQTPTRCTGAGGTAIPGRN